MSPSNEIPRRAQMQEWSKAEFAIHNAIQEIEKMPASPILTKAITLLQEAKSYVADFVDGGQNFWKPEPRSGELKLETNLTEDERNQIQAILTRRRNAIAKYLGKHLENLPGAVQHALELETVRLNSLADKIEMDSFLGKFVTAKLKGKEDCLQGYLVRFNPTTTIIRLSSGEEVECERPVTVVINPEA